MGDLIKHIISDLDDSLSRQSHVIWHEAAGTL